MSAAAEHCTLTWLVHGECDRVQWAAMLWTMALIPSEVITSQEAGQ